ncbi:MAG TPA: peptidase C39 family protein [Hyphomicrobiales bacterium]|nr:peptidase C39 family protein [Hyphomicrobiales bacterium]
MRRDEPAPPRIRAAESADLDALERLEHLVFPTDRLSRRSFRRFLQRPSDALLVAEEDGAVIGYALLLFRERTALARLYSVAVDPKAGRRGIGRLLLDAAEAAAVERGCVFIRLEVRADNAPALALYAGAGYRQFGRYVGYYQDQMDALRFEKRLVAQVRPPVNPPPYFEQTLDFTCGPACLVMILGWADPRIRLDRTLELKLWREATTIFMTSGLGGCEPFGLAVTLARRGLKPELYLSHPGPYFLDGVRSDEKRTVMRLTQQEFRGEAATLGIPVRGSALGAAELSRRFDEGAVAIVLVSGYRMFRKKAPHWVLAHGHDGRHIFIHDPWVEDEDFETPAAATNLPIPVAEFERMARYGRDQLRATILIRKGSFT